MKIKDILETLQQFDPDKECNALIQNEKWACFADISQIIAIEKRDESVIGDPHFNELIKDKIFLVFNI